MTFKSDLGHPVFLVSMMIVVGVFFLIGMAILGLDNEVLLNMARSEFARGLITYLFSVVTIGTAVVLIVSLLTSDYSETNKERIDKGKDILSLLLGVFGTIVGFYFGSEIGEQNSVAADELTITSLLASEQRVASSQQLSVTAAVVGGDSPYQYRITIGADASPSETFFVGDNGWIVHELSAPVVEANTFVPVMINVEDVSGNTAVTRTTLAVSPQ